jgi:hypothetical protein
MRSALLLLMAILPRCSSGTEPEGERSMGAITGYNSDDPRIEIVTAPGRAVVRVTTYGGGCHSKGDTDVRVDQMTAVVTPFDYVPRGEVACTQQLVSFLHEATVSFARSGSARILVRGLDIRGDTVTVERRVEIP